MPMDSNHEFLLRGIYNNTGTIATQAKRIADTLERLAESKEKASTPSDQ